MFRATVAVLIWSFASSAATNPYERDPQAIKAGKQHFQIRCSGCHGVDARGGRGPNLHRSQTVAAEDFDGLFDAIKNGIPGTEMVPLGISTDHTWQIVSYLRSLTQPGAQAPVEGDVDEGRQVFEAVGCRNCHMIAGVGGILGPDLSGVGRARSSEAIRESVLDPSKVVLPGFKGALIIDQTGRVHNGVIKNEDNFTIQFLTTTLERVSLNRPGLRAVDLKKKSFMPENYGRRLDQAQLQNLLAFLDRRRQPTLHYEKGFGNY